jgi:precorrin-4 methylase
VKHGRTKQRRFIPLYLLLATALLWLLPTQSPAWGRGTFYIIGIGPAGPQTATLQALETIKKMDAIVASDRYVKLFADYVGDTPMVFDPWKGRGKSKRKPYDKLTKEEKAKFQAERLKVLDRNVNEIKKLLAQGKDVGLLASGNPCLLGPTCLYVDRFDPNDVIVIPGMGCDAAAMAALKRSTIPAHGTRFVLQSAPHFLTRNIDVPNLPFSNTENKELEKQILTDLAKYEHTMVLYMALRDPVTLFNTLGKYLPKDMPAACVFWAGYPDKQRVVRGTVADMGAKLAKDKERGMGLLFVGRFLQGQPYENAMRKGQKRLSGK